MVFQGTVQDVVRVAGTDDGALRYGHLHHPSHVARVVGRHPVYHFARQFLSGGDGPGFIAWHRVRVGDTLEVQSSTTTGRTRDRRWFRVLAVDADGVHVDPVPFGQLKGAEL